MPAVSGVATTVTVTLEPGFTVPIWATSCPPLMANLPALAETELKTMPGDIGMLSTTPVAGFGPVFKSVAVKVKGLPATTVCGVDARATRRLTEGATVAVALALLLGGLGSY